MARFTLAIECDNAAFDELAVELARTLRHVAATVEVADSAERLHGSSPVRDVNGNTIGAWHFEADR